MPPRHAAAVLIDRARQSSRGLRDVRGARKADSQLPPGQAEQLTSHSFFPHLVSGPFHTALVYAFAFAIVACLVAAVASLLRGGKYHHAAEAEPLPSRASNRPHVPAREGV